MFIIIVFDALSQGRKNGLEGYFPKSFVIVMKASKVSCICSSRVFALKFQKTEHYLFYSTHYFTPIDLMVLLTTVIPCAVECCSLEEALYQYSVTLLYVLIIIIIII